ncbi:MAG: hypothetical protein L7F78_21375 [Syntrophales bacterium LBB04]|nr:hypothetical protein [Syntrophales bacterium LBB04]
MKKGIILVILTFFVVAVLSFAAENPQQELRPAQKLMQARVAWVTAMKQNLRSKKFEALAQDAEELAAQTMKVGENLPNPLAKELELAISSLAKDVSAAAAKQDGDIIKVKLGEILGKCDECHVKIRDKK